MSKNYVLHSNQESRDNGITSILAIVFAHQTHFHVMDGISSLALGHIDQSTCTA